MNSLCSFMCYIENLELDDRAIVYNNYQLTKYNISYITYLMTLYRGEKWS